MIGETMHVKEANVTVATQRRRAQKCATLNALTATGGSVVNSA